MRFLRLFFVLGAILVMAVPFGVAAIGIDVSPATIDLKGKPRDNPRSSIRISNPYSSSRITVYGFDVSLDEVDPSEKEHSLLPWLQYPHTIKLEPGEIKDIDLVVDIFPYARPGFYHADLVFARGSTRGEAENRMSTEGGSVRLTVEVLDNSREEVLLNDFRSERQFTPEEPVIFLIELNNSGTVPVSLEGSIMLADRRGAEMGSTEIAPAIVEAGQGATLRTEWGKPLPQGRYKAYLALRYGKERVLVQDTATFWFVNLRRLGLLLFGGALLSLLIGSGVGHLLARRRALSGIED